MKTHFYLVVAFILSSTTSLTTALSAENAQPAGSPNTNNMPQRAQAAKRIDSPFSSCSDIKVISKKDYSKMTDAEQKSCSDNVQSALGVNSNQYNITNLDDKMSALHLMHLVTDEIQASLKKNIEIAKDYQNCFAGTGTDCDQKKAQVREFLNTTAHKLRIQLALSNVGRDTHGAVMLGNGVETHYNTALPEFNLILDSNPVGDHPLDTKSELPEVRQIAQQDIDAGKSTHESTEIHSQKYREIVLGEAPLFSYLPKADWKSGSPEWSDAQLAAGFQKVLDSANKELALTEKTMNQNSLEWSDKRGYQKLGKWLEGERNLLDYIVYTPAVESVLSRNPEFCGVATSLMQHYSDRTLKNNIDVGISLMGLSILTGGFGGAALKAAGLATDAARASSLIGTAMGMGMGMGFSGSSINTYRDTRRAATAKSGASAQEKSVQTSKAVNEAENGMYLQTALHLLGDYWGAGKAGTAIKEEVFDRIARSALMKQGLKQTEAEEVIRLAGQGQTKNIQKGAQEAIAAAKKKMGGAISSWLDDVMGKAPSEIANDPEAMKVFLARVANLGEKEQKATAAKALVLYKKLNGSFPDPAVKRSAFDASLALAGMGERDSDQLAKTLIGWQNNGTRPEDLDKAFKSLTAVAERAQGKMKDPNFMKGVSEAERRQGALGESYQEMRTASDPEYAKLSKEAQAKDRAAAVTCATGGVVRADLSPWDPEFEKMPWQDQQKSKARLVACLE